MTEQIERGLSTDNANRMAWIFNPLAQKIRGKTTNSVPVRQTEENAS